MCEAMSELNFQSLMGLDLLEQGGLDLLGQGGLDLEMGFQQAMPDLFQDASMNPGISTKFLPDPEPHGIFETIPFSEEFTQELQDLTNSRHYSMQPVQHQSQMDWKLESVPIACQPEQQQQQHYQEEWRSDIVPSTTTSPVECMSFNIIPSGYEHQFVDAKCVNGRKRRAVGRPCRATLDFDTTLLCTDTQNESKPKRKRVQNSRQRKAANVRERNRMNHLNDAFDSLKTRVPTFSYEKRLSRIETRKLAMDYISFMTQVLEGKKSDEISLKENGLSFNLADLGQPKGPPPSSYVYDGTESSESGTSCS